MNKIPHERNLEGVFEMTEILPLMWQCPSNHSNKLCVSEMLAVSNCLGFKTEIYVSPYETFFN